MGRACSVHGEIVLNPEGKTPPLRPRLKWESDDEMYLKETRCEQSSVADPFERGNEPSCSIKGSQNKIPNTRLMLHGAM
jgi:hypothetical protein